MDQCGTKTIQRYITKLATEVQQPPPCAILPHSIQSQHVPIPTVTFKCKFGCCSRTYIPLDLAFSRTIHRFQGLSAGPVDDGKIPNMYTSIVCDPDDKSSETLCTGLLYTALSRATTLGDDDGLNSAIYFTGSDITRERIQRVTKKKNKDEEILPVTRRKAWMEVLYKNTVQQTSNKSKKAQSILKWTTKTFNSQIIHTRVRKYMRERTKATQTTQF